MMDELINKVKQTTGLSTEQAQTAVETVLGFLKQRLPAPMAGALDSLIGGQTSEAPAGEQGLAGEAAAAIGSIFGSKT